jgi:hypothetical protein
VASGKKQESESEVILFLKHHAMKTYGEVEIKLHAFLSSALYGGERSTSRSGVVVKTSWPEIKPGHVDRNQLLTD